LRKNKEETCKRGNAKKTRKATAKTRFTLNFYHRAALDDFPKKSRDTPKLLHQQKRQTHPTCNLVGANMDLGPQLPIFHPLTEFPTESWKNMTPVITSGI